MDIKTFNSQVYILFYVDSIYPTYNTHDMKQSISSTIEELTKKL